MKNSRARTRARSSTRRVRSRTNQARAASVQRKVPRQQRVQSRGPPRRQRSRVRGVQFALEQRDTYAAPVSENVVMRSQAPRFQQTGRSCRVSHRELVLGSIAGSTTYTVQNTLILQPGNVVTFPWLSAIANQWDEYVVHALVAEYIPIASSATSGDIMLVPDYNVLDSPPPSEAAAMNFEGAIEERVWAPTRLRLDPRAMKALGPRRYTRNGPVTGDLKTYDLGNLFICTNNEANTNPIGKLWLSYDFEFFVPQTTQILDLLATRASQFISSGNKVYTTTVVSNQTFATTVFDAFGIVSTVSGSVFTPPAGLYRITATVFVSDNANEAFAVTIQLLKNTVASGPLAAQNVGATGTTENITISTSSIISCNGSDTISAAVTATGAAGVLTAGSGGATLTFELV